jgi:hypothetical protein
MSAKLQRLVRKDRISFHERTRIGSFALCSLTLGIGLASELDGFLARHFLKRVQDKLAILLVSLAQQSAEFVQKFRILA